MNKIILAIGFYLIGSSHPLPALKKRMTPTSLETEAIEGILALEKGITQHSMPASHPIPDHEAASSSNALSNMDEVQSQLQNLVLGHTDIASNTDLRKIRNQLLATTQVYLESVEQDPLSSFSATIMRARQEYLKDQGLVDIARQEWKKFEESKRLHLSRQQNNSPSTSASAPTNARGSTTNSQKWIKAQEDTVIHALFESPENRYSHLASYQHEARTRGMYTEAVQQIFALDALKKLAVEDKLYGKIMQNVVADDVNSKMIIDQLSVDDKPYGMIMQKDLADDLNTKMIVDQAFLISSGQVEKAASRLKEFLHQRAQVTENSLNHQSLAPDPTRQEELLKAVRAAKHQDIIQKSMKDPLNEHMQDLLKNYLIDIQRAGLFREVHANQQFIIFTTAAHMQALQHPTSESLVKFIRIRNIGTQDFTIPEESFASFLKNILAAVIKSTKNDKSPKAPLSVENLASIEKLLLTLLDDHLVDLSDTQQLFEAYVQKFSGSTVTDSSAIERVYRILDLGNTRLNLPDSVIANAKNQFTKNVWTTVSQHDLSLEHMLLLDTISQRLSMSLEERLHISETLARKWNVLREQSSSIIQENAATGMKQAEADRHVELLRQTIEAIKSPHNSESRKAVSEYVAFLQQSGASTELKDWERDHAHAFSMTESPVKRSHNH